MQELDDIALLREYVGRDSEEAFAALVARHVNRVYSVALRHTGSPHSAEEITQAVFVILARKSSRLSKHVILAGWLHETARLTAMTFIRSEIRRGRRELEAHMQTALNENESAVWTQIAPWLDAALAGLPATDRHAVVLRFFYGQSLREIGTALGGSEDMARMRVSRALEKLQKFFLKRGVSSTTAIIAGAISANSVQIAPAMLTKSAVAVAMAQGATAGSSTLTLIKKNIENHGLDQSKNGNRRGRDGIACGGNGDNPDSGCSTSTSNPAPAEGVMGVCRVCRSAGCLDVVFVGQRLPV
jgi:RNA polymerase sigma factor (sigma-70 family)